MTKEAIAGLAEEFRLKHSSRGPIQPTSSQPGVVFGAWSLVDFTTVAVATVESPAAEQWHRPESEYLLHSVRMLE